MEDGRAKFQPQMPNVDHMTVHLWALFLTPWALLAAHAKSLETMHTPRARALRFNKGLAGLPGGRVGNFTCAPL